MVRPPLVCSSIVVLAACGGPDVHAAYQRIQVEEARIAHAAGRELDRTARCDEICDAAASIASVSQTLEGDADAAQRAARARASCSACREETP